MVVGNRRVVHLPCNTVVDGVLDVRFLVILRDLISVVEDYEADTVTVNTGELEPLRHHWRAVHERPVVAVPHGVLVLALDEGHRADCLVASELRKLRGVEGSKAHDGAAGGLLVARPVLEDEALECAGDGDVARRHGERPALDVDGGDVAVSVGVVRLGETPAGARLPCQLDGLTGLAILGVLSLVVPRDRPVLHRVVVDSVLCHNILVFMDYQCKGRRAPSDPPTPRSP